jgi:hypothetical protein
MMMRALGRVLPAFLSLTLFAATASAQQDKTADVAKKSQNPISDMISVPFQENANFNVGRLDKTQSVTNIQPVVPIKLDQGWTLVTRWILPIIYQPSLVAGDSPDFGFGDFNPSFFLTAPTVGGWTVGVGPTFLLPTATDARLGTDRWSAGPTAVAVLTQGNIVAGVLANNIWSFTGKSDHGTVVLRQSGNEIRVGGKTGQPAPAAAFLQLQSAGWLVSGDCADPDRRLGGSQGRPLDGASRRWLWSCLQDWYSASQR